MTSSRWHSGLPKMRGGQACLRTACYPAVCFALAGPVVIGGCQGFAAACPCCRFLGGVREEFGPTPHVVYIVCPSIQPKELHSTLVDASLVLRECATTVNVAAGVSIAAPESSNSAAPSEAVAAQTNGATTEPDEGAEADVKSEQQSDYIQMKGTAESTPHTSAGPRLQLLTVQVRLPLTSDGGIAAELSGVMVDAKWLYWLQVVSQAMLMDITGHAAKFLALSSYSRQLHPSGG